MNKTHYSQGGFPHSRGRWHIRMLIHPTHQISPISFSGFSLVEVLVALLILSIGLLGIAALQLSALKTTDQAYLQSMAAVQVTSMSERLRANYLAANNELNEWNQQNKELLPQAKGEYRCANAQKCTVTLRWNDGEQHLITLTS